jgi:hypothetical protein
MMRTLLRAPTCDRFAAGAASSYQACGEIRAFPTGPAPAGASVPCSKLIDVVLATIDLVGAAPPRQRDLAVLRSSASSFSLVFVRTAGAEDCQSRPEDCSWEPKSRQRHRRASPSFPLTNSNFQPVTPQKDEMGRRSMTRRIAPWLGIIRRIPLTGST